MTAPKRRLFGRSLFTALFLVPLVALLQVPVFIAGAVLGAFLACSQDLPKVPQLASYQPRTVSTFFADDGTVIGRFYKQKRFVKDLNQIPPHVIKAFLGAEDSRFYKHNGVDWTHGMLRALLANIRAGRFTQGGSTITMQVTRNFLLTRVRRLSRKIKEILLAYELERVWGKKKILYVYLNEIYLGEGCYGVEAAARGYFGKPVEHLSLAEGALIAGLVASPSRYNPFKSEKLARQRQRTVLRRMLNAELITKDEYEKALKEELVFKRDTVHPFDLVPDFTEAVRRYIIQKYGEAKLYNEGLKVFTTCKVDMQKEAQQAMTKGINEIKSRHKHFAILKTIPRDRISEVLGGRETPKLVEGRLYQGVVVKVIRGKQDTDLRVALSKRLTGKVRLTKKEASPYRVGQILALRFDNSVDGTAFFHLDSDPKLQGALVLIENNTGYVRALLGGAYPERFQFNRAIQARRQPGSAFKPIIYSAAIEKKSYTPATIVVDEPIAIDFGDRRDNDWEATNNEGEKKADWEPKNAGGKYLGPISVRTALELSRNICTIKVLMDVGIDPVTALARKMGITSPLGRNLSLSLGATEVTLYELTSAYTVFPNGGVYVKPVLVKRIEDRMGNVLEDNTKLPVLDPSEMPKPTPREEFRKLVGDAPLEEDTGLIKPKIPVQTTGSTSGISDGGEQQPKTEPRVHPALSPQTAYIMTSILQGGLVRGTGAGIRSILKRKDLAGKTGTTNGAADTWFIGFNPDYTAGVWVGCDEKRPIGKREGGGRAALPIWGYLMKDVLANVPVREFQVPPDIVFEETTTYVGNRKQGFAPGTVTEPVYAPMLGLTLVLCPVDPPELLQEYGPALISGEYPNAGEQTYPAVSGTPSAQPASPIYPGQQEQYSPQALVPGSTPTAQPGAGQQPEQLPLGPHVAPGRETASPPGYRPSYASPGTPAGPAQGPYQAEAEAAEPSNEPETVPQPQLPQIPDLEQQPGMRPYYPGGQAGQGETAR